MWSHEDEKHIVVGILATVVLIVGSLIGLGLLFAPGAGCIGVRLMHP